MNTRIRELLEEIRLREEQLADILEQQQAALSYRLDGTRVRFEESVRQAHQRLKTGLLRWLWHSEWRNLASAPVIYPMIVPFLLLDAAVSFYQWTCFPLYRIKRVRRSAYIVIDRHRLSYMNSIEKLNCVYCGYVSGLLAYCREIVARTEQYWCPIKHARKILDPHKRYARFSDFGDAAMHAQNRQEMRLAVRNITDEEDVSSARTGD
ncbi:MAG: hypothetical protein KDI16_14330 [Halioglobus sp.]|nr:hypothetical protein [Halioglobus sp.]